MKFSPLYPHLFLTDDGEVYAHGVKRLLPSIEKGRYAKVAHKNKSYYVHRIVASIHCGGYAPGLAVDHIDGNKLNNEPSNLEWVSRGENTKRAWVAGLTNTSGENHGGTNLREMDVINIRSRYAAGELQRVLAADFGVPRVTISNIVRGKAWKRLPTIGTIAPAKPHVMTPEKLAIGLKLIARGLSITAAACEIAVSRRTLSRAVHKQKQKETP